MTKRIARGTPVEVLWLDICGQSGWRADHDVVMRMMPMRSVGMFLKQDRATITIAQSMDDDTPTKTNERLTIGRSNVRALRILK